MLHPGQLPTVGMARPLAVSWPSNHDTILTGSAKSHALAYDNDSIIHIVTRGKYSLESTDPRESEIRARHQLTIARKLSYYLFIIVKLFKVKDGCLKFVYIGKNPRFMAFLDSKIHTWLAIVT